MTLFTSWRRFGLSPSRCCYWRLFASCCTRVSPHPPPSLALHSCQHLPPHHLKPAKTYNTHTPQTTNTRDTTTATLTCHNRYNHHYSTTTKTTTAPPTTPNNNHHHNPYDHNNTTTANLNHNHQTTTTTTPQHHYNILHFALLVPLPSDCTPASLDLQAVVCS
jgi:hypothetical protein